jgi:hypothetical protein
VFNRFSFRKKQGRGSSEDPAAPFLVSRSTGSAAKEMVDYALVDETVNEWMTEASRAKNAGAPNDHAIAPVHKARSAPKRPQPVSHPTTRSTIPAGIRQTVDSRPLQSKPLPHPVLHRADQPPLSLDQVKRLDRVLTRAYAAHLLAPEPLHALLGTLDSDQLEWRQVAREFPECAHVLSRTAAETYGFRSVLICQMGTLVLADLLTMRVPSPVWQQMFEIGLVPVVEHGVTPDPNERILCATPDPSSRTVRDFLQGIKSFRPETVYADEGHLRAVMELLAQHVPAIGAQVRVVRPDVVRIDSRNPAPDGHHSTRAA